MKALSIGQVESQSSVNLAAVVSGVLSVMKERIDDEGLPVPSISQTTCLQMQHFKPYICISLHDIGARAWQRVRRKIAASYAVVQVTGGDLTFENAEAVGRLPSCSLISKSGV
jgi:hypothetical protein